MKRKKLPDDFQLLIDSHDMEAFAAFFKKFEITATNTGKSTSNAFSYKNLTAEHVQFLLDNGLNPNADCGFGYPAVAHQASNKEALECLIQNGADINYVAVAYRGNALARACSTLDTQAVKNLLEEKASINITCDIDGKTLLDAVLAHCDNLFIPNALEICKMLFQAGAKPDDKSQKYVEEIGNRFEFFRSNINPDMVNNLSDALTQLYELFDVTPDARRVMNRSTEEITVTSERWQEQYEELWQKLVPGRGNAETLQGEMIRIVGRVTHEILDNGALNWDADYRKMVNALANYLKQNEKLDSMLVNEACNLAKSVSADSEKTELYRLTELVVNWVVANSVPRLLGDVDYVR